MRDASSLAQEEALQALEAQRDAFDRYVRLLDVQQAAFRAGDLSLVESLTPRTDALLREIHAHSVHVRELYDAAAAGSPGREAALRPLLSEVGRRARQAAADQPRHGTDVASITGSGTDRAAPELPAAPKPYVGGPNPGAREPVIDRRG